MIALDTSLVQKHGFSVPIHMMGLIEKWRGFQKDWWDTHKTIRPWDDLVDAMGLSDFECHKIQSASENIMPYENRIYSYMTENRTWIQSFLSDDEYIVLQQFWNWPEIEIKQTLQQPNSQKSIILKIIHAKGPLEYKAYQR